MNILITEPMANGIGTGNLAAASEKIGARMFYISSDYVFDGQMQSPYQEEVEPKPLSIYLWIK